MPTGQGGWVGTCVFNLGQTINFEYIHRLKAFGEIQALLNARSVENIYWHISHFSPSSLRIRLFPLPPLASSFDRRWMKIKKRTRFLSFPFSLVVHYKPTPNQKGRRRRNRGKVIYFGELVGWGERFSRVGRGPIRNYYYDTERRRGRRRIEKRWLIGTRIPQTDGKEKHKHDGNSTEQTEPRLG